MTGFEFFDRVGRPLLRLICVAVIAGYGAALVLAAFRSAETGLPMPDMTGGLSAIITAIVPLAIDQITRARQREAEIRAGQAPGPFGQPSSPPSSPVVVTDITDSQVNPHGGPNAP